MGDAQLQQFLAVTDAPEAAARFFLESSGGDVAAAVDAYFATGGQLPAEGPPAPPIATGTPCGCPGLQHSFYHIASLLLLLDQSNTKAVTHLPSKLDTALMLTSLPGVPQQEPALGIPVTSSALPAGAGARAPASANQVCCASMFTSSHTFHAGRSLCILPSKVSMREYSSNQLLLVSDMHAGICPTS